MIFNQVELGKRIHECREHSGMTQAELSERIGCSSNHLSRIERGIKPCSIDLLAAMSSALQVSTDYLLTGMQSDWDKNRVRLLDVVTKLTELVKSM